MLNVSSYPTRSFLQVTANFPSNIVKWKCWKKTFLYCLTIFPTRWYVENSATRSIFPNTYLFHSKLLFLFFNLIGWKFDRFQARLVPIYKRIESIDFWVGGFLTQKLPSLFWSCPKITEFKKARLFHTKSERCFPRQRLAKRNLSLCSAE